GERVLGARLPADMDGSDRFERHMDGAIHRCAGRLQDAGHAEGAVLVTRAEVCRAKAVIEHQRRVDLIPKLAGDIRADDSIEKVVKHRALCQLKGLTPAILMAVEIFGRRAHHAVAAMAVTQRDRNSPGYVRALRNLTIS